MLNEVRIQLDADQHLAVAPTLPRATHALGGGTGHRGPTPSALAVLLSEQFKLLRVPTLHDASLVRVLLSQFAAFDLVFRFSQAVLHHRDRNGLAGFSRCAIFDRQVSGSLRSTVMCCQISKFIAMAYLRCTDGVGGRRFGELLSSASTRAVAVMQSATRGYVRRGGSWLGISGSDAAACGCCSGDCALPQRGHKVRANLVIRA